MTWRKEILKIETRINMVTKKNDCLDWEKNVLYVLMKTIFKLREDLVNRTSYL